MGKKKNEDRHKNPREAFHLSPELLQALTKYIESCRPSPNKSDVFRVALEDFLSKEGYWPRPSGSEKK